MKRTSYLTHAVFWLTAGLVGAAQAGAVEPIPVDALAGTLDLDTRIELLEDADANLTFDDIQSPPAQTRFAPLTQASPNFGFTPSAWWVRLTLSNDGDFATDVLLRQDYPLIDYLDVWHQDTRGAWQRVVTGDRRPFITRDVKSRDFIFTISVPAGGERAVYLRYASSGPINIGLTLSDKAHMLAVVGRGQLGLGMYFGGFLVLLVYNLFIFVAVRDRAFFHYLAYLACYGAYFAVHNGLTFQYLWPNNPWWGNHSLVVLLALSLFWGLQFSRSILNSAHHSPRLDRAAAVLQWLSIAGLIGAFFVPYATIILPLAALSAATPPLLLWMGTLSLLGGHKTARYFLVAWTTLLVGVAAYMLKSFGLLPHNFVTQNGFQIGSLIEMLLLSLALASRVSELQQHSFTDALTGLLNRRRFDARLDEEFVRSLRYGQPLSLMMIDVDHFKAFNDTYGHRIGDDALRAIAERMRQTARRIARVCRYGGEEFVILLPATDHDEAEQLAGRLREQIEALTLSKGRVTISVGVATMSDGAFPSASEFVDAADQALYAAKQDGRNRVASYTTTAAA